MERGFGKMFLAPSPRRALPRAQRAINKGYNLVDMSRRSLTYETRLFKYSKRGFAVAIPGFEKDRVDPRLTQKNLRDVKGLAKLLLLESFQRTLQGNGIKKAL